MGDQDIIWLDVLHLKSPNDDRMGVGSVNWNRDDVVLAVRAHGHLEGSDD